MSGETVGEALKRWRLYRGMTLRGLGDRVHVSHVYLWEIEKGVKPGTAEIIACCDQMLDAGGQLMAIAARSRPGGASDKDTERIGLILGSTWTECVEAVTELWRHDASRRAMLRGAMLAPTVSPIGWWLDDTESDLAREREGRVSADNVRQMTSTFRRLDNLYGGNQIRPAIVQFLDSQVGPALADFSPQSLGGNYLGAVAELTHLAGWLAYDDLEHGLGQRYFFQALHLARWAGDRNLGSEILAAMSHQAIFLHQPDRAIALAEAAQVTAQRANFLPLVAESSVMKAHAYALQDRESECMTALHSAQRLLDAVDQNDSPEWMSYFDEAYVAAIAGHCYRAMGKAEQAEQSAQKSLNMSDGYLRGRLFNQLLLAESQILKNEIEQACAIGQRALDLAAQVNSGRAITFIERLLHNLRPWRTNQAVKDLAERARLISI